jgi:hypothetical protein
MHANAHVSPGTAAVLPVLPGQVGLIARDHRQMETYPCPRCSSFAVRRSKLDSVTDGFLRLLLIAPYRCHRCYRRFRRLSPAMRLMGNRSEKRGL